MLHIYGEAFDRLCVRLNMYFVFTAISVPQTIM